MLEVGEEGQGGTRRDKEGQGGKGLEEVEAAEEAEEAEEAENAERHWRRRPTDLFPVVFFLPERGIPPVRKKKKTHPIHRKRRHDPDRVHLPFLLVGPLQVPSPHRLRCHQIDFGDHDDPHKH
jgi:hypothetical protein